MANPVVSEAVVTGNVAVREGDVLDGKYRIQKVLGVGGMGLVVAARHIHLDEQVAIKFLRPEATTIPEMVARFEREARAAIKIKSEHVARVMDVGRFEDGAPYMVMEHLDGSDLEEWLAREGFFPVPQAVDFVLQACEAVAEAHTLGIVHRDLKPANLFCVRRADGGLSIKVLDFGISKVTGAPAPTSMATTREWAILGSPEYMSPEQMASSRDADARSDIWSLGVILFELVGGRVPFEGTTVPELAIKIVRDEPASLRGLRPEVPRGLEQVILRCLAKDRAERYADIGELANALLEFGPPEARLSVERVSGILKSSGHRGEDSYRVPSLPGGTTREITGSAWGRTGPAKVPGRWRGSFTALLLVGGSALLLARAHPRMTMQPTGSRTAAHAASPATAPASAAAPVVTLPALTRPDQAGAGAAPARSSLAEPPVRAAPVSTSGARLPAQPPAGPVATPLRPWSIHSRAIPLATAAVPSPASVAAPDSADPIAAPLAPPVPARAPAAPAQSAACDPPYFTDSAGLRQYRPECF